MPRTLVVIPAYNEEASLERVVRAVRASVPGADIAVVNDGSRDGTGAIVERLGVVGLHLPHNVGIGAAEQTGFRYAERFGYDVVVRNDGDGQHDPAEIPQLLEAMERAGADVVIGSRYLEARGYVTPRLRKAGIVILARVIGLVSGWRCTDPTSGFRAFNHRAIRLCAALYPHDYPEPESVVLFVRAGLRVREIPVTMNPRWGGQSSIRLLDSAYYMIKVLLAIFVGLLREAPRLPAARP
jgi:glycosyltransferase involved in cell wall biosynthesis